MLGRAAQGSSCIGHSMPYHGAHMQGSTLSLERTGRPWWGTVGFLGPTPMRRLSLSLQKVAVLQSLPRPRCITINSLRMGGKMTCLYHHLPTRPPWLHATTCRTGPHHLRHRRRHPTSSTPLTHTLVLWRRPLTWRTSLLLHRQGLLLLMARVLPRGCRSVMCTVSMRQTRPWLHCLPLFAPRTSRSLHLLMRLRFEMPSAVRPRHLRWRICWQKCPTGRMPCRNSSWRCPGRWVPRQKRWLRLSCPPSPT